MRVDGGGGESFWVAKQVLLDDRPVKSARAVADRHSGGRQISIRFTEKGAETLAEVTRKHVGRQLAMVIAGKLVSAPRVMDQIRGGRAVITGRFDEAEAKRLAARIQEAVDGR
jgi:preprotein translocase subunit SecD